jgi:hypothetical protein
VSRRVRRPTGALQFLDRLDELHPHGLTVQVAGFKALVGALAASIFASSPKRSIMAWVAV